MAGPPRMELNPASILVIKLGALGDFVQALGPFSAIRHHYGGARIVLLTTRPYRELAEASGFFDEVWTNGRPGRMDFAGWFKLRHCLVQGGFGRIYDLQTSGRSSFYRRLFWPAPVPEWSGIAHGCSHPHTNPGRDSLHTIERQAEQLEMAGITEVQPFDPASLDIGNGGNVSRFGLVERYVLLAPAGAAHRPGKRWPKERFTALARALLEKALTPVLLGTAAERPMLAGIAVLCPGVRDLSGETSLLDLVSLGRRAVAAVGNDTGPMHLMASLGCPSVVLYSNESDPTLCGQRGPSVTILRRNRLADVSVVEVVDAMEL
jgi:ADP-heptose:LPS heptosyltransferase